MKRLKTQYIIYVVYNGKNSFLAKNAISGASTFQKWSTIDFWNFRERKFRSDFSSCDWCFIGSGCKLCRALQRLTRSSSTHALLCGRATANQSCAKGRVWPRPTLLTSPVLQRPKGSVLLSQRPLWSEFSRLSKNVLYCSTAFRTFSNPSNATKCHFSLHVF